MKQKLKEKFLGWQKNTFIIDKNLLITKEDKKKTLIYKKTKIKRFE